MKTSLVLLILFQFSIQIFAQSPAIQWQNSIGGTQAEDLRSIQQTSDGGYILGGSSNSNATGDKTENSQGTWDYWVVKLNASGGIVWQNTIGGNGSDKLQSIQQTSDGGYILGGYSDSNASGDKSENCLGSLDYWVIKLDASGNIQWENTLGGSGNDEFYAVRQTSDGGFLVGGSSSSGISGDKTEGLLGVYDYWVLKLNASGSIVWQNIIGGEGFEELWSLQITNDGGCVLGGSSNSGISGDKNQINLGNFDYWVVKIDSVGTVGWQNTIGGSGNDFVRSLGQSSNGDLFVAGFSDSNISGNKTENSQGGRDFWVVKLSSGGSIIWQNTIGGSDWDENYTLVPTPDGGCLLGGTSSSPLSGDKTEGSQGSWDYWILKLNSAGNIVWQNTIGGNNEDKLYAACASADGGFCISGTSASSTSGDKTEDNQGDYDFWVLKLGSECPINFSLSIAPQPCLAKTKITVSTPMGGTAPYSYKLNNGAYQTSKTFTVAQSGSYTITVKDATNCTFAQTIFVAVTPLLVATVSKTNVTCFGAANGAAIATASGGVAPYNFQWKQGTSIIGTGTSIGNLAPGSYKLIATDAQNCSKTVSFSITQPSSGLTLGLHSILPQGSNFKVRLTVMGGTAGAKNYRRCDPIGNNCTAWQTSYTFQNTPAGTYQFQVKDVANCTATLTIAVPTARPASARSAVDGVVDDSFLEIYPNPVVSENLNLIWKGEEEKIGRIQLVDIFGEIHFEKTVELSPNESLPIVFGSLAAGTYFVKFIGDAGFYCSKKVVIFSRF